MAFVDNIMGTTALQCGARVFVGGFLFTVHGERAGRPEVRAVRSQSHTQPPPPPMYVPRTRDTAGPGHSLHIMLPSCLKHPPAVKQKKIEHIVAQQLDSLRVENTC